MNSRMQQRSHLLVVQETGVLFRVEHLKESASRVAIDSLTNLVNFIDEDQGILDSDTLECLDNLSGEGTVDV